jgi:starch synthase (maltosyl-transferring)
MTTRLRLEIALITLINGDVSRSEEIDVSLKAICQAGGLAPAFSSQIGGDCDPLSPLKPREVRVVKAVRATTGAVPKKDAHKPREVLSRALAAPRIVIDAIEPSVEGGIFPTRYMVNDSISVAVDIFTDGHPVVAAEIRWKRFGDRDWLRVPLQLGHNDRWHGRFCAETVGTFHFIVVAWIDEFASTLRDIKLKEDGGEDVALDLCEVKTIVKSAAAAAEPALRAKLTTLLNRLADAPPADALALLSKDHTQADMRAAQPRRFLTCSHPVPVEIERTKASFASWYELFPRSASPIAGCHGTFDDVIARLPDIRAMGFDVIYLPPVHPIGRTNRKGRNNSLPCEPSDPGSPYAIGAHEGGHDAIHNELGSFEDFERLIRAAWELGLEVAVDFAVQCSPDHPWLKAHREWFRWRTDGSLRFAENPPKKYEDIVNVEFYPEHGAPDLWIALRDIVLFWVERGIKIFRVDNPHTKPLPFWQWLIADIRAERPDVIFLSEAFTRPKMMYRLAKIGFSQSYSYFTWRNTKREITDYLTELTTPPAVDFFRPHFFVNTPDINPFFLQQSGRAGFLIRAVLAATLSGLWGIYSGFELCEAAALPGREEYLDSEKYEIKSRNFNAAGNIKHEISVLNQIRKSNPALHTHRGLTFYNAFNDYGVAYGKALTARNEIIFVIVSLDPHNIQDVTFEMPLWEWKLADHESLRVHDLIHGGPPFVWTGKLQHVRLDPSILPYAIWRLTPINGGRA